MVFFGFWGFFCLWTVAMSPLSLQLQHVLVFRVGVECSACLFLGKDISLHELVKLLKDWIFYYVQD